MFRRAESKLIPILPAKAGKIWDNLPALALAAVAACTSGAHAADAPLVARLKTLCVATKADPAAAQAAADALGWKSPPDSDARTKGGQVVRANKDADGNWELVVGRHELPFAGQPVSMNMCAVGLEAAKIAPVEADIHAWLGVDPSDVQPQMILYAFSDKAAGRTVLPPADDARLQGAAQDGSFRTVVINTRKGAKVLTYALPTASTR